MNLQKKLYKNPNNKMIAGVCSGMSDYFEIDVSIVRLLFVGLSVFGGAGLVFYIAAAIILPEAPIV